MQDFNYEYEKGSWMFQLVHLFGIINIGANINL